MNNQNLRPIKHLTKEEAKRRGANGGRKSGESRRRKRDIKKRLEMLLSMLCADNDRKDLETLGMPPEYWDNETALVVSIFKKAAAGDTRAFDKIMQILEKDVAHQELALRKRELKLKEDITRHSGNQSDEIPQLYKALTEDNNK